MSAEPQVEQAHALQRDEKEAHACFDSNLEPLELRVGRRLSGPWRPQCFRWFDENSEGFCRVRDDVLARPGVRSPFALFVKMLADGDHHAAPLSAQSPPALNPRTGCTHGDCRGEEVCIYP